MLQKFNHQNIIKLHEVYEKEDQIILIMDWMKGGDLLDRLRKIKKYLEEKAAMLMKSLLEILAILENNRIIHRDLKLSNILLLSEDDDISIKVADFGLSTFENIDCRSLEGTPGYLAPELFYNQRPTHKSDIYSTGIILYAL